MVNSIVGSELGSTVGIAPARRRAWELHRVWDQHRDQRLGSCWSGSSLESTYIMGSNAGSNLRDQHWWGGWGGGARTWDQTWASTAGSMLDTHWPVSSLGRHGTRAQPWDQFVGSTLARPGLGSTCQVGSSLGSNCGIETGRGRALDQHGGWATRSARARGLNMPSAKWKAPISREVFPTPSGLPISLSLLPQHPRLVAGPLPRPTHPQPSAGIEFEIKAHGAIPYSIQAGFRTRARGACLTAFGPRVARALCTAMARTLPTS